MYTITGTHCAVIVVQMASVDYRRIAKVMTFAVILRQACDQNGKCDNTSYAIIHKRLSGIVDLYSGRFMGFVFA